MNTSVEEVQSIIEKDGRIHWLFEPDGVSTQQLIAVLQEFRESHPLTTVPDVNKGEVAITYADRETGWAIEVEEWQDSDTGEVHHTPKKRKIVVSANTLTKNPASFGKVELKLSNVANSAVSIFVQLLNVLDEHFPGTPKTDKLEKRIKEYYPHDDNMESNAERDTFELSVSKEWLLETMKDIGRQVESDGSHYTFRKTLFYRIGGMPKIEYANGSVILTWLYAWDRYIPPTELPRLPAFVWHINEQGPKLRVEATCHDSAFNRYFYELITLIRKLAVEVGKQSEMAVLPPVQKETESTSMPSKREFVSKRTMPATSKQVTHANSDQTQQKIKALPIPDGDELLTTRQREVAHLLAEGMSDEAIADNLVISPHTVKTYRRNIGGKWGKTSGPEKLQEEARKRGYGIGRVVPQSIPKDTL